MQDIKLIFDGAGLPNARMSEIIDYRALLTLKNFAPSNKSSISKTKKIHFDLVFKIFYQQHPNLFKKYLSEEERKKAVVLDLGCGEAYGVENWVDQCKEYHGVDILLEQLHLARKYIPKKNYPNSYFYHDTISSKHFSDEFADFLISSEVIEHIEDPEKHIRYCFNKLKPNRFLSLSTPCPSIYLYPSSFFPRLLSNPKKLYKSLQAHLYWKEALGWHPALRPSFLKKMLETQGFDVKEHYSCLWYWESPLRLAMRITGGLEKIGMESHLRYFDKWIHFLESLTESPNPLLRFAGTRQFVIAQKPE